MKWLARISFLFLCTLYGCTLSYDFYLINSSSSDISVVINTKQIHSFRIDLAAGPYMGKKIKDRTRDKLDQTVFIEQLDQTSFTFDLPANYMVHLGRRRFFKHIEIESAFLTNSSTQKTDTVNINAEFEKRRYSLWYKYKE